MTRRAAPALPSAGLAAALRDRLARHLPFSQMQAEHVDRFVAAAQQMQADGWWWTDPATTNRSIRRGLLAEMFSRRRDVLAAQ